MSTIFRHRLYPIYVEVSYIRDSFTVLLVRGVPYLVHREGNFSRCREGDYMGFIEHYFPFIEHETTLFLPEDTKNRSAVLTYLPLNCSNKRGERRRKKNLGK